MKQLKATPKPTLEAMTTRILLLMSSLTLSSYIFIKLIGPELTLLWESCPEDCKLLFLPIVGLKILFLVNLCIGISIFKNLKPFFKGGVMFSSLIGIVLGVVLGILIGNLMQYIGSSQHLMNYGIIIGCGIGIFFICISLPEDEFNVAKM